MYRQGDVLLERVEQIESREITEERLLVQGEGRNHAHYIIGDDVMVYENVTLGLRESPEEMITHYLDIRAQATLEHLLIDSGTPTGEHATIAIPPGKYKVIRQREFNPYDRTLRLIRD